MTLNILEIAGLEFASPTKKYRKLYNEYELKNFEQWPHSCSGELT